ncbi:hypothetical protein [Sporobacter termitidis]|uniref:hypothetical protein n=1 Tax=Sporobacter termitidis TaxID=44749 RepID=UPI0011609CEF|nr:hypothetical protein [Sporobacter termitidis]
MTQLIQWHEDAAGPNLLFLPEMTDVSSYLYPTTLSLADRPAVRPFFDISYKMRSPCGGVSIADTQK